MSVGTRIDGSTCRTEFGYEIVPKGATTVSPPRSGYDLDKQTPLSGYLFTPPPLTHGLELDSGMPGRVMWY